MAQLIDWDRHTKGTVLGRLRGHEIKIVRNGSEQRKYGVWIDGVFQDRKSTDSQAMSYAIKLIERNEFKTTPDTANAEPTVCGGDPAAGAAVLTGGAEDGKAAAAPAGCSAVPENLTEEWQKDPKSGLFFARRNGIVVAYGRSAGKAGEFDVFIESGFIGTAGNERAAQIKANKAVGYEEPPVVKKTKVRETKPENAVAPVVPAEAADPVVTADAVQAEPVGEALSLHDNKAKGGDCRRSHAKVEFSLFRAKVDEAIRIYGATEADIMTAIGYSGTSVLRAGEADGEVVARAYNAICAYVDNGTAITSTKTIIIEKPLFTTTQLLSIIETYAGRNDIRMVVTAARGLVMLAKDLDSEQGDQTAAKEVLFSLDHLMNIIEAFAGVPQVSLVIAAARILAAKSMAKDSDYAVAPFSGDQLLAIIELFAGVGDVDLVVTAARILAQPRTQETGAATPAAEDQPVGVEPLGAAA